MGLRIPARVFFGIIFTLTFTTYSHASVNVNLTLENLTAQVKSNQPVTVGHVFKEGDVPAGETLAISYNGADIPAQVDKKAVHRDGSLRHAVISFHLPVIQGNGIEVVTLYNKNSGTTNSNVSLSQLVSSNFDSVITLVISGKTYTASAKNLLQTTTPKAWLSGSEVGEWIVTGAFRDASNNPHPHLTARFNLRAYAGLKNIRVAAIVENNWTYVSTPGNVTYDVSISVGGNQVYNKRNVEHYHHARWRKLFWWGTDPEIHVMHNLAYMKLTKAIPNYDSSLKVSEATLSSYFTAYNATNNDIMGISILKPYMPSTGGRPDIGPLPQWTVLYLLSMDRRVWEITKNIGEQAGSWSSHYRDKKTDLPVTLTDYPQLSTHSNLAGVGPEPLPVCSNCSTPYTHDESHQASMAYVPYLVTGDYYFLEELQFWANQNSFKTAPLNRGNEKGLLNWMQVRGQAWSMRTLAEAAYITPDAHALKSYFNTLILNNINNYVARYTGNGTEINRLGVITDGYSLVYNSGKGLAPWQDDFFTWAVGHVVELGFTEAIPLLNFKSIFSVGRMTAPGYCWIEGSIYQLNVRSSSTASLYNTFTEAYNASVAPANLSMACAGQAMATANKLKVGEMVGYSHSPQGYPSNMQPALAISVDSGINNAAAAWQKFDGRSVKPYSPAYDVYPNWAIVPRSYRKPRPPSNISIK